MRKYEIVEDVTASALANQVNDMIADGWRAQGGVTMTVRTYPSERNERVEEVWKWAQAMIRII